MHSTFHDYSIYEIVWPQPYTIMVLIYVQYFNFSLNIHLLSSDFINKISNPEYIFKETFYTLQFESLDLLPFEIW